MQVRVARWFALAQQCYGFMLERVLSAAPIATCRLLHKARHAVCSTDHNMLSAAQITYMLKLCPTSWHRATRWSRDFPL